MASSSLDQIIAKLQSCKDMPRSMVDKVNAVIGRGIKELTKEASVFLSQELDDEMHTEDEVKAIINAFPESLSQVDESGLLPLQRAICRFNRHGRTSPSFVPLLAKEGSRLGVGGTGMRGGLLTPVPRGVYESRSLQYLARVAFPPKTGSTDKDEHVSKARRVLEKLRESGLLTKEDIVDFKLLAYSLPPYCADRFELFADWNPNALSTTKWVDGAPLIHLPIVLDCDGEDGRKDCFETVLRVGMKHFPTKMGFLFRKYKKITALEAAMDRFGPDEAMKVIRRCIPQSENHPILHHANDAGVTSILMEKMIQYYPDAVFIKDTTGRTLSQAQFHSELRSGNKTFDSNASFFVTATDAQVEEKDPQSGLYPFMMAASDNTSDSGAVYHLVNRSLKLFDYFAANKNREAEKIDLLKHKI